ncbi:MAG: hypothetical protein ACREMF_08810 [Gemmatimonadales bacterium]
MPDRLPSPDEVPPDALELHQRLDSIRFNPRASLEPEMYARLRREGETAMPAARWRWVHLPWASTAAVLGVLLALVFWSEHGGSVRLDRCCWDLDGGIAADDGVVVVARRGEEIRSLLIYEDRDGNGRWSVGDVSRLSSEGGRARTGSLAAGLVTQQVCCGDYDAGGAADDGIFVLGAPPDRVFLAGVYEDRDGTGEVSAADFLRYLVR